MPIPRLSLRTFLICALSAGVLLAFGSIATIRYLDYRQSSSVKFLPSDFELAREVFEAKNRSTLVSVGHTRNRILSIKIDSFAHGPGEDWLLAGVSVRTSHRQQKTVSYLRPDKTVVFLPLEKSVTIIEQRDGQWTELTLKITLEQWRRFVDSRPTDCRIDLLTEFVRKHPDQ